MSESVSRKGKDRRSKCKKLVGISRRIASCSMILRVALSAMIEAAASVASDVLLIGDVIWPELANRLTNRGRK